MGLQKITPRRVLLGVGISFSCFRKNPFETTQERISLSVTLYFFEVGTREVCEEAPLKRPRRRAVALFFRARKRETRQDIAGCAIFARGRSDLLVISFVYASFVPLYARLISPEEGRRSGEEEGGGRRRRRYQKQISRIILADGVM